MKSFFLSYFQMKLKKLYFNFEKNFFNVFFFFKYINLLVTSQKTYQYSKIQIHGNIFQISRLTLIIGASFMIPTTFVENLI